MFLNKIEIIGFKSFRKKITLEFSGDFLGKNKRDNLTVIAGPNGSGKSNIVDAFSWVLGEQSMIDLRGEKKEDLIFSGSKTEARSGMASVSIFFDNKEKNLPIDYEEVKITRKLYRNGENEYLINDTKTKLIDIWQLTSRAGIGKRGYSIIRQGLVDRILNANSIDRLDILEEAIGIKEFQIKKQRSQKKIKISRLNLERSKLVLSELLPKLKMIQENLAKADKLKKIKQKLKEKKVFLLKSRLKESWIELLILKKKIEKNEQIKKNLEKELIQIKEQLAKEQKTVIIKNNRLVFLQGCIRDWQKKISTIEKEKAQIIGQIEVAQNKKDLVEKFEKLPVDNSFVVNALNNLLALQVKLNSLIEDFSIDKKEILVELTRQFGREIEVLKSSVLKGSFKRELSDEKFEMRRAVFEREIKKLKKVIEKKEKDIYLLEEKNKNAWNEIEKNQQVEQSIKMDFLGFERKKRELEFDLEKLHQKNKELESSKKEINQKKEKFEELLGKKINQEDIDSWTEIELSFKLEKEITRLEVEIDHLGEVDELIDQEYEELKERVNFFQTQSEDLEGSINRLEKSIKDFQRRIRTLFDKSFPQINEDFNRYFKLLFSGGFARIEKVVLAKKKDKDQILNEEGKLDDNCYGVDFKVRMPEKKVTNLNALSGGERSLVSLAFLFALIVYNPPPLVILDEVEASLDEANTARFIEIMQELSSQTQFVVITHNQATMRSANLIYGVYMQEAGNSKVISLKLN